MSATDIQRIVSALLTPDAQQFENFLAELMNPDNTRRKFAEAVLSEMRKHADVLVRYLIGSLGHSGVVAYRAFSAMLLRKGLTTEFPLLWPRLSDQVKDETKQALLQGLQSEKEPDVLFKTSDAVSELARYLSLDLGWPELLPRLSQMMSSDSTESVTAAFRIIGGVADILEFEQFLDKGHDFVRVLEVAIAQGPVGVKNEAISTFCCIAVVKGKMSDRLRPMIPAVAAALMEFLTAEEYTSAEMVLESLIDVAEDAPRFLKKSLKPIFSAMFQVAFTDSIRKSIRVLAVELLLSIVEQIDNGLSNQLKSVPNCAQGLFEVLMMYLNDVEDDPEWHNAEDDNEDAGAGTLHEFGMEALDRLALAYGGRVIVPIAGSMLNVYLNDESWKKRHAAFICLSQIAEGCENEMLKEVETLTDMCVRGLADPAPRVRWAACQAIGQMCTDLAPDLQESQHHKIVPSLMTAMKDSGNPRVQAHAAAALVNFCDDGEEDEVLPYIEEVVHILLQLMYSHSKRVAESAVSAMATVAENVKQNFAPYYNNVMPQLRLLFTDAVDPKLVYLRAKALECISLVGVAVGGQRFRQDASEVMAQVHQLHQAHLSSTDPLPSYMIRAGARMCRSLEREFIPYLEIVMPHVIRDLTGDTEIKISATNGMDSEDDDDIETFHVGGKLIKLRTSAMEDKATACEMIASYAAVLKDGFLPYVKPMTDQVVPLLKFVFNEEVRIQAYNCLPELLGSTLAGMNCGAGVTSEFLKEMVEFVWPAALEALDQEEELEVQEAALKSIASMVDVLTPHLLSEAMVESCFKVLQKVFKESEDRRAGVSDDELDDDDDDDGEDYENVPPKDGLDEEVEMELDVLEELSNVLAAFMKKYGDTVIIYIAKIMPMVTRLLEHGRSPQDRRIAITIIDDILDHCPQAGNNYLHGFLPFLIKESTHENANLRQISVFGLGIVAAKYPEAFLPHLPELLPSLIRSIQDPRAKERENEMATDNAISTVGKIIQQFPDKVDPEIVDHIWLKNLPLLHDDIEARIMHKLFVTMVEQQDARVLGRNSQNLILVKILGAGKEMTMPETETRICRLLQSFSQSMGNEVLNAAVTKMTPKQQKTFHEFSATLNGEQTT